jgi:hypothetical protein
VVVVGEVGVCLCTKTVNVGGHGMETCLPARCLKSGADVTALD